jgi:hypothetical protein
MGLGTSVDARLAIRPNTLAERLRSSGGERREQARAEVVNKRPEDAK